MFSITLGKQEKEKELQCESLTHTQFSLTMPPSWIELIIAFWPSILDSPFIIKLVLTRTALMEKSTEFL